MVDCPQLSTRDQSIVASHHFEINNGKSGYLQRCWLRAYVIYHRYIIGSVFIPMLSSTVDSRQAKPTCGAWNEINPGPIKGFLRICHISFLSNFARILSCGPRNSERNVPAEECDDRDSEREEGDDTPY